MEKNYKEQQKTKKNIKRMLISALCTVPLLFILGVVLGENINRGLRILIFSIVLLLVVGSVEYIHSKRDKKEDKKPNREDVFK